MLHIEAMTYKLIILSRTNNLPGMVRHNNKKDMNTILIYIASEAFFSILSETQSQIC